MKYPKALTGLSIRRNPKIVGISLPNRNGPDIETKVNMFADDTQLINKTSQIFQNTNLSTPTQLYRTLSVDLGI
jgi:hypothetical protein